jgi:hypothetical protein
MKRFVVVLSVLPVLCLAPTSAHADVCGYQVTERFGSPLCPVHIGDTLCVPVAANRGPCDAPIQCEGGPGLFCELTLVPTSGPQPQCPFGSLRSNNFVCFAEHVLTVNTSTPVVETPTSTPEEATASTTPTDTPTATASPTGVPTGTSAATTTVTATLTPTEEPTGTPTGTTAALVILGLM